MTVAHLQVVRGNPSSTNVGMTDQERVLALYEAHRDQVFGIALRYGRGDRTWAEDVTQDVFVGLFSDPGRARKIESPDAWLYRITTNRCLTRLKREHRRRRLLSGHLRGPGPTRDPEHIQLENDRLRRALAHLDRMTPEARTCFYMHHLDARPQKEIAEVLGRSPSYVCRLLQKVERSLQEMEREVRDA